MEMNFISGFEFENMPNFQRDGDAAIDLRSPEAFMLQPGEEFTVNTGMIFDMSQIDTGIPGVGIAAMILPRSGLGFKFYTRLANTVGLIDSNYQGEIMVKVRNEHKVDDNNPMGFDKVLHIAKGDRFCQMVFIPVFNQIKFNRVDSLQAETNRGAGGLGSSGQK